jgi:hypothetical protein
LFIGEDCSTSFQIDDPVNAGECCTEDADNPGQCLDCTATSQIEDPDNPGTCCDLVVFGTALKCQ